MAQGPEPTMARRARRPECTLVEHRGIGRSDEDTGHPTDKSTPTARSVRKAEGLDAETAGLPKRSTGAQQAHSRCRRRHNIMNRNLFRSCTTITALALLAACGEQSTVSGPRPLTPTDGPDFGLLTPANGPGACMGDDGRAAQIAASSGAGNLANWVSGNMGTPPGYNCTANDISIAKANITKYSFTGQAGDFTTLATGGRIQCEFGQTVFIETVAEVLATATQRWDIGIWIADPVEGSAMNGSCKHYNLLEVGTAGTGNPRNRDGDQCGDMGSGAGTVLVPLDTLQVVCPGGQPTVTVNNCVAWSNSDLVEVRGTCPAPKIPNSDGGVLLSQELGFRYGTVPENGAKCNCTPFQVPIDVRGKITIIKNTVGGDGTFDFTSDVGANSDPVVTSPFQITTTSNTGTQVFNLVKKGTYHIAESTPPAGFDLTSIACVNNNTFVTSSVNLGTATATLVLNDGGDVTCTFTNTKRPDLTLVKIVTNDDGGTKTLSDFPLTASKTGTTITGVSGTTAVTSRSVPAGTYALSEQTQAGYTASAWSCVGGTQDGSNITLTSGSATCTITNDDKGSKLTLVKIVTNNSGGTATLSDFPLTASKTGTTITGVSGTTAVTDRPVPAGTYALSEQTVAGYTASSWSCVGGSQSGSDITLALDESATCTITNDDQPATLTLVKVVTNDHGGTKTLSDFPLTASKTGTTITGVSGTTAVTTRSVPAGSYALSEQTQAGYTASAWNCVGGSQTGSNIALGLGGSATCTITNDDNPASLTIIKYLKGDAQSFGFSTTGTGLDANFSLSPATNASAQKEYTNLSAGTYTITEDANSYLLTDLGCSDQAAGTYDPKVTRTVSVTLAIGESKSCSFTNDQPVVGETTRTQGYWSTHMSVTDAVWFGKTVGSVTFDGLPVAEQTLCGTAGRELDTIGKVLGGFWASIPTKSNGKTKRSALDKARMQLAQQLLAAILNREAFGSQPSSGISIDQAKTYYCGTDISLISQAASAMGAFNEAGDSGVFTPGVSANGKQARAAANIPFWDPLP
jgi:Prealbumin-like fold domain